MRRRARLVTGSWIGLLALAGCSDRSGPPARASSDRGAGRSGTAAARPAAAPAASSRGLASRYARTTFHPYPVVDRTQGGLAVGTLAVPDGWNATSSVQWHYPNVSWPVQMALRVASPDGAAWIESFPSECFYWLEPPDRSVAVGARSLGMIHAPGIGPADAMRRFLIARYRGGKPGLKVVGLRPIGNLAAALGKPPLPGDSIAARIHWVENGHPVDEILALLLTRPNRIPYRGPQGTTYEDHRVMGYAHAIGARDGRLDELAPLLSFVTASFRPDPIWEKRRQQVQDQLNAQFNRNLAAGYARIAAAGALSRAISANNDAMIGMIEAQRQASNRSWAASRASSSDSFDQYIRGTERMNDPYWGTSEQDYTNRYHWTDGQGNYRHSNDAGFNPNVGSSQNWTLMERSK